MEVIFKLSITVSQTTIEFQNQTNYDVVVILITNASALLSTPMGIAGDLTPDEHRIVSIQTRIYIELIVCIKYYKVELSTCKIYHSMFSHPDCTGCTVNH